MSAEYGGVFKSSDHGASWSAKNKGLTATFSGYSSRNIVINPNNPSIVYLESGEGTFRSLDDGENWSSFPVGVNGNGYGLTFDPVTPLIVYALTTEGPNRSINGGESWTDLNNGLTNPFASELAIDPVSPNFVFVGTIGGGIFDMDQLPYRHYIPAVAR